MVQQDVHEQIPKLKGDQLIFHILYILVESLYMLQNNMLSVLHEASNILTYTVHSKWKKHEN